VSWDSWGEKNVFQSEKHANEFGAVVGNPRKTQVFPLRKGGELKREALFFALKMERR